MDSRNCENKSPNRVASRGVLILLPQPRGLALQYVAKKLRGDREIVMTAVGQRRGIDSVWVSGTSPLEYAAQELRGDRELVMMAGCQDWRSLKYATEELSREAGVKKTTRPMTRGVFCPSMYH